jgi:hypothetical protein
MRSNEIEQSYWMQATRNGPKAFIRGPRLKSGKLKLNLHRTILEKKLIGLNQKNKKKTAHDLKNKNVS